MDEYATIVDLCQRYPGIVFRNEHDGMPAHVAASWLAVRVPRTWFRAPAYHIHQIRPDGRVGQRIEIVEFEEARHANA